MPVYLGLDCGGSTCRALALDATGEPIFWAQGGSANLANTPDDTLQRSLSKALEGAPTPDFVCGCFAGLIDQNHRQKAENLIRSFVPNAPLRLEPDYAAALRACPEGTTLCVIAGTGSIVCSRSEGQLVRSGGGGFLLGDEGSGFRYGRAALRHFLNDPKEASEDLRGAIEQLFGTLEPGEIVQKVYKAAAPAALLAHLSASLLYDASQKAPYAVSCLQEETRALADTAIRHHARYHKEVQSPLIGLAGGMWKRQMVRDAFAAALGTSLPHATVRKSEMPPARGAALLAMEMDTR